MWVLPAPLAPGCTCRGSAGPLPAPAATPPPVETADGGATPAHPVVLDMVRDIDTCSLGHRGVLLDFGDPSMKDEMHPGFIGRGDDELVEHEGATWLRARSRTVTASFTWPAVRE